MIKEVFLEEVTAYEVWLEIDGRDHYLRTFSTHAKAEERIKDNPGKIVLTKAFKITSKTHPNISYIVSDQFVWFE